MIWGGFWYCFQLFGVEFDCDFCDFCDLGLILMVLLGMWNLGWDFFLISI